MYFTTRYLFSFICIVNDADERILEESALKLGWVPWRGVCLTFGWPVSSAPFSQALSPALPLALPPALPPTLSPALPVALSPALPPALSPALTPALPQAQWLPAAGGVWPGSLSMHAQDPRRRHVHMSCSSHNAAFRTNWVRMEVELWLSFLETKLKKK